MPVGGNRESALPFEGSFSLIECSMTSIDEKLQDTLEELQAFVDLLAP
jgi:hypothetical protein